MVSTIVGVARWWWMVPGHGAGGAAIRIVPTGRGGCPTVDIEKEPLTIPREKSIPVWDPDYRLP